MLRKFFSFLQLLASFSAASSELPCASFQFPSLNGPSLATTECTTVTIPFKLDFRNCNRLTNFSVAVDQVTRTSQQLQCLFLHEDGKCLEPLDEFKCACRGASGMYELTHTVDRSDNSPTTLLWSSNVPAIGSRKITFDVTCPAKVSSLLIDGHQRQSASVVDENSLVTVVCIWKHGNPPVTARLLDRHGVEMEGSIYSSGQINYTFPVVACQDAGLIRCEAPGASHNQTVTLLVRCSPDIKLKRIFQDENYTVLMRLTVRTHTATFKTCKLRTFDATVDCSVVDVSGTLPYLGLTVRLDNVTSQNQEQMRLELTNDVGTGRRDFDLEEMETMTSSVLPSTSASEKKAPTTTDTDHHNETGNLSSDNTALVAAFAGVALTVVVTVIAVCRECCRKLGQSARHPPPAEEIAMRDRENVPQEQPGSHQSAHYYMEVPDSPPPSDESSATDEVPPLPVCNEPENALDDYLNPEPSSFRTQAPPPVCHGPGNPPDDYLKPQPSRDETEEEGTEWKTVPFYQNTQLRNMD